MDNVKKNENSPLWVVAIVLMTVYCVLAILGALLLRQPGLSLICEVVAAVCGLGVMAIAAWGKVWSFAAMYGFLTCFSLVLAYLAFSGL